MTKTNDSLLYLASLPERLPRAVAASAGGLLYESSLVLLPEWTRDTQLYQTFIGRGLRIVVEWAGGVQGVMPPSPVTAGRLAVRKVAGNAIELTSFLIVGWSPLWMLAAAADLTGGTQVYLHALTDELKRLGMLPPEQEFTSVDGLLDSIEGTTGVLSRAIDIPPLAQAELQGSAKEMRAAWLALRENLPGLPTGESLRAIANQMQQTAERENTSVWLVSSLIGLGAVQAGIRLGQASIYDYYRSALGDIRSIGLSTYVSQVSKPYRAMVAQHLDPQRESYIERTLKQVRTPRLKLALPARKASR
jgi:hypothetical protein